MHLDFANYVTITLLMFNPAASQACDVANWWTSLGRLAPKWTRILEDSWKVTGCWETKNHFQTHGTVMGTKMAVSFANIFMAAVETEIINRRRLKSLIWKRYIDDFFSLWNINKEEINTFIELANNYHNWNLPL